MGACASGPSAEAVARDVRPSTTTTTEAAPEGIFIVAIENAAFKPAIHELDLDEFQIVRWENSDTDRSYVVTSRDRVENEAGDRVRLFESPEIPPGGTWEFDFSTLEVGVHRYFTTVGAQTIPGLMDTRPAQ